MSQLITGFVAAMVIAAVCTPVGVSGAVFLLPVQLSVLGIPNPAVTPTNLLFNVVASPAALLRYRRVGRLSRPLVWRLLSGSVPGVLAGASIRVFLMPGPQAFRVVMGALLLPLGVWLIVRTVTRRQRTWRVTGRRVTVLSFAVGTVGGVYGIGGGSLLAPLLVSGGLAVTVVAPAALATTWVTSIVGVVAFVLLAAIHPGSIAPDWPIGLGCGLGGLVGGYLGARVQPRLPERGLRLLLGLVAIGLSLVYLGSGLR